MSQWIKTKLGEIVILNYGKALKAQDRNAGSIPVYSSGGLTGWHNKALINEQGIIIGRKGTVGKAYLTYGPFCVLILLIIFYLTLRNMILFFYSIC